MHTRSKTQHKKQSTFIHVVLFDASLNWKKGGIRIDKLELQLPTTVLPYTTLNNLRCVSSLFKEGFWQLSDIVMV